MQAVSQFEMKLKVNIIKLLKNNMCTKKKFVQNAWSYTSTPPIYLHGVVFS
jgi:hypothetical protein